MDVGSSKKNTTEGPDRASTRDRATLVGLLGDSESLDDVGIQGLMYVLKEGLGLPLSYEFTNRLSGPYSAELLEDVQHLVADRVLDRRDGRYCLGDAPETEDLRGALTPASGNSISLLVKSLNEMSSARVAMLPTMLLALRASKEEDSDLRDESVIKFVSSLRPTLPYEDVRAALVSLPIVVPDVSI